MTFFDAGPVAATAGGKKSSTLHWLAHLGAFGVFSVSLVDATIIPLAIPGSTDLLLLWLISNGGSPYLLVGSGVAGSLIGGWTTWRLGKKGGEAALHRYVPKRQQQRVQGWSQKHPILVVFLPAILPPPIPLWPFLLAAGALGASWQRFLTAFGLGRLLRYSLVGWLAVTYGRHMVKLWAATLDKWSTPVLCIFLTLTAAGLAFSLWKLRRAKCAEDAGTSGEATTQNRSGATAA
ncbi:MAG TPA: VTT domain-containing protein [Terracidiphilus sp.]